MSEKLTDKIKDFKIGDIVTTRLNKKCCPECDRTVENLTGVPCVLLGDDMNRKGVTVNVGILDTSFINKIKTQDSDRKHLIRGRVYEILYSNIEPYKGEIQLTLFE